VEAKNLTGDFERRFEMKRKKYYTVDEIKKIILSVKQDDVIYKLNSQEWATALDCLTFDELKHLSRVVNILKKGKR